MLADVLLPQAAMHMQVCSLADGPHVRKNLHDKLLKMMT